MVLKTSPAPPSYSLGDQRRAKQQTKLSPNRGRHRCFGEHLLNELRVFRDLNLYFAPVVNSLNVKGLASTAAITRRSKDNYGFRPMRRRSSSKRGSPCKLLNAGRRFKRVNILDRSI